MDSIQAPNYIKHMLTNKKGEIDSNTIIVGDFNIHLHQRTDHPDRKINKETLALNDTLDQTGIYLYLYKCQSDLMCVYIYLYIQIYRYI